MSHKNDARLIWVKYAKTFCSIFTILHPLKVKKEMSKSREKHLQKTKFCIIVSVLEPLSKQLNSPTDQQKVLHNRII